MSVTIPSNDGELNEYDLTKSATTDPRIHYVNGIQTDGRGHARTAALLSLLTERPIWGVYNKTSGMLMDLGQCALDYIQNAGARASKSKLTPDRNISYQDIPALVDKVVKGSFVWNKATVALFKSLMLNIRSRQMIVAHSQGNLLTSNALFVVERVLGSQALSNIRVYSLASPSPGWPLGIRVTNGGGGRQENAYMNDLVALLRPHNLAAKVGVKRFQNAGDFRRLEGAGPVGLKPHEIEANIALNFLQSIRNDLGMPGEIPDDLLADSIATIDAMIP
ncbi:MAG: hypothetical protein AAFN77_07455 [Planctomycetota bacterium]